MSLIPDESRVVATGRANIAAADYGQAVTRHRVGHTEKISSRQIAEQAYAQIAGRTTVSVERSVTRLLGVDGADALEVPLPNVIVDHVHHAGNSSRIVDGSALMLIGTEQVGQDLGLTPRAKIISAAVSGADPTIMLTGPIPATEKVLKMAGLKMKDIDLFECNEAFAPVVLAWMKETGADPARVNVNGGAIALGHPLGSSGARLLTTILYELERRNAKRGLVTMCIGMGQGVATIIERI